MKPAASGSGNGASWVDASGDLQAMINASAVGDSVWVTGGTYFPTRDPSGSTSPADLRTRTFNIPEGVRLFGGFAGTEVSVNARNLALNATTLSGDLGVFNSTNDNAYQVVRYQGGNFSVGCTIDGFHITRGAANMGYTGGGISISRGQNHVLKNLYVHDNFTNSFGGGIYLWDCSGVLLNDSVYSNSASGGGGGIYSEGAVLIDSSAVCANNSGGSSGGGIWLKNGNIRRSLVLNNTAGGSGGGIFIQTGMSPEVVNCAIGGNSCGQQGGGVFLDGGNFSTFNLISNAIYNNTAQSGGGVYQNFGTGTYINNTFYNNSGQPGAGGIQHLSGNVNLSNNIFWQNKSSNSATNWGADISLSKTFNTITYYNNLFQNPASTSSYALGPNGGNNLFVQNPQFVNAAAPAGADNVPRTADDGLRVGPCSPVVNAGQTPAPAIPTDILGNARSGTYDIGAYEATSGTGTGPATVVVLSTGSANPSCAGSPLSFSATAVSPVVATGWRWEVNGVQVAASGSSYSSSTLASGAQVRAKVLFTNACGNPDSAYAAAITVVRIPTVVPGVTITSSTACPGQPVVFSATATNTGTSPAYSWLVNGLLQTGATGTSFTMPSAAAGSTVRAILTSSAACATPTTVQSNIVTVSFTTIVPTAAIVQTSASPICQGSNATFTATVSGGGTTPTYSWQVGGSTVVTPGPLLVTNTLANGDAVQLTFTSSSACATTPAVQSNTLTASVAPLQTPTVSLALSDGTNPSCTDSLLEFTATGANMGGTTAYHWLVNGQQRATGPVFASTAFADADVVTVLAVTGGPGCRTSDSAISSGMALTRVAPPVAPSISFIGNRLVANYQPVQWHGPNGVVPNLTDSVFQPNANGTWYAVALASLCPSAPSNQLTVSKLAVDNAGRRSIRIFPNPSNALFTVEGYGPERLTGEVFNVLGQRIRRVQPDATGTTTISLAAEPAGIYHLVLRSEAGLVETFPLHLEK